MAWGMWRARYWAVLGMQTLLGLTVLLAAIGLVTAVNVSAALLLGVIIVAAGTLFWFLVKAMARIQMPERPARTLGAAREAQRATKRLPRRSTAVIVRRLLALRIRALRHSHLEALLLVPLSLRPFNRTTTPRSADVSSTRTLARTSRRAEPRPGKPASATVGGAMSMQGEGEGTVWVMPSK